MQIKSVKGFALLIDLDGIVQLLLNNRANLFADMVINYCAASWVRLIGSLKLPVGVTGHQSVHQTGDPSRVYPGIGSSPTTLTRMSGGEWTDGVF